MCEANPPNPKAPAWLSCQEVVDQLLDYVDGELSPEARQQLERHFKLCPPCREFLGQYRALPGLCSRALGQAMPDEAVERLANFLRARAQDGRDPSRH